MNYQNFLFAGIVVPVALLFSSCGNDKNTEMEFSTDFENIRGWGGRDNNVHTVVRAFSKSGNYASKTDSVNRFGYIFKTKIGDVSDRQLKTVKTSVWVSTPVVDDNAVLVISIDSADKNIDWSAQKVADFVKTPNQWTEVMHSKDISNFKPEQGYSVGIYLLNNSSHEIFTDDHRVKFFE